MKEYCQTIALWLLAVMLWSALYPKYSLLEESYYHVENGYQVEQDAERDFWSILKAKYPQVKVESKLWELWCKKK